MNVHVPSNSYVEIYSLMWWYMKAGSLVMIRWLGGAISERISALIMETLESSSTSSIRPNTARGQHL